jgi:hypothetical protein
MSKRQTAVEWLVDELLDGKLLMPSLIEEAKQMEKDQMKIMFEKGIKFMSPPPGNSYMAIKNPKQ